MLQSFISWYYIVVGILVHFTSASKMFPRLQSESRLQPCIATLGLVFAISGIPIIGANNGDTGIGRLPRTNEDITQPARLGIVEQMTSISIWPIPPLMLPFRIGSLAFMWDHEYRDPDAATIEMRLSYALEEYLLSEYGEYFDDGPFVSAKLSVLFNDSGRSESERLSVGTNYYYDAEEFTIPAPGFYCYKLEVGVAGLWLEQYVAGAYLENGYTYEVGLNDDWSALDLRQSGKSMTILLPPRSEYSLSVVGVIVPGDDNDILYPVPSEVMPGQSAISVPLQTGEYGIVVVHGEPSRTDELRFSLTDFDNYFEIASGIKGGSFQSVAANDIYMMLDEQVFGLKVDDGFVNLTTTRNFCNADDF